MQVFETSGDSCTLIKKEGVGKSITALDVVDWSWAPTRNVLIMVTKPSVEDASRDP